MLWFAFIFLSLSYWQQRETQQVTARYGCDLLSFSYLCRTDNNVELYKRRAEGVVICFHFPIFVVLTTTPPNTWAPTLSLWFAFIFVSLSYWQQLPRSVESLMDGCDLLSFSYLCRTDNNDFFVHLLRDYVVICFHFPIFVVLTTTQKKNGVCSVGCDLLSFSYLCRTDNNRICIISWISVC